jgi:DsbC/DsbD-like thiol-disulfide interchange protein
MFPRRTNALAISLMLIAYGAAQGQGKRSDAVVKVAAKSSTPDSDGKQIVTVTLTIEKGWHIIANPPGDDELKTYQTVVSVTAKQKLKDVKIEYPRGKKVTCNRLKVVYRVYDDTVKIKAVVYRCKGDTGPLEASVTMQAFTDLVGYPQATVKVPVE